MNIMVIAVSAVLAIIYVYCKNRLRKTKGADTESQETKPSMIQRIIRTVRKNSDTSNAK